MNRIFVAASLATMTTLLPGLRSADPKPDFSGTWEMDTARSESTHYEGAGEPVTKVIRQTADEFMMETRQGGRTETLVYKLDGTETKRPAEDNGAYHWRAHWDGAALTTETQRNIKRTAVTVQETRTLNPQGKEMIVNWTFTVQHGYEMKGAKNYSSGKDVFVRTPTQ